MLELKLVNAGYSESRVLFDVSLEVRPGEVVTLLGRNGAGKSTTLKTIVALTKYMGGTVNLNGERIDGLQTHEIALRGIGYVPEERRIYPALTVEENLRVARPGTGHTKRRVDDIFEYFPKLRELRKQRGGWLSGGEQQMLSIGRTLMSQPDFLLLDEPSEGLAPIIVQALRDQILRLKAEGITTLLSEQNMMFARAVSDRVYVIDRGTIWFSGTFEELDANSEVRRKHLEVGSAA